MIKIGMIFERLTVVSLAENDKWGHNRWLCKCICGKSKVIVENNLNNGLTKSCGCLLKERQRKLHTIHGFHSHKLYKCWQMIKERCYNKNKKYYKRYGGRGISLCVEWLDPEIFIKWALDNGWQEGLQIDRIDNNGNYEPSNCHFVNNRTNSSNKTINKNRIFPVGVYKQGNKFRARIRIDNKRINLGSFTTSEEARKVYLDKIKEIEC